MADMLTAGDLRRALADYPADTPVWLSALCVSCPMNNEVSDRLGALETDAGDLYLLGAMVMGH